jgi:hypothetical protein
MVKSGRLAAAFAVLACVGMTSARSAVAGQADSTAVTFTKHIAPILQAKCETCHRPGSIGPMPLQSYQDVRPWIRSIKSRVSNREMPPWSLDKTVGIQKFINDASLSDEQIDLIVRWIDAGAPAGNAADMPAPRKWNDNAFFLEARLGPPDLIIKADAWTMPAQYPDIAFQSVVDIPGLTEPRWIRASETRPSLKGRRIAHHSSTYVLRPRSPEAVAAERAARGNQPGADLAVGQSRSTDLEELFTEWAQGKDGEVYAENVGKLVMPGTKAKFDVHYHAVGEEITDQMEVAWWFHPKGKTPEYSSEWVAVGSTAGDNLQIPPNTIAEHQGYTVLKSPAMLHNFQPHMHYRGKAQTLEAIYPDGRREVINRVTKYDNTWHINYIYDPDYAPVFPKGTVLMLTSVHDNTAANKNNPDPRQWVSGGARTVDEMAHLNEQVIYISDADYERITEERKKRTPSRSN